MVGRWTRVANSGASSFVAIKVGTAVGSRLGAATKAALCVPKLLVAPPTADGHAILTWRTRKRFDLLATVM